MVKSSASNLWSFLFALVILGFTGWYGWGYWQTLSEVKANLIQADSLLLSIEAARGSLESDYDQQRAAYMQSVAEQAAKVEGVFPTDEYLTLLTRSFDELAFSLQGIDGSDPFFMSQLAYGEVEEADGYRVLPISMSLDTSENNLYQFLEYIESSGSLDPLIQLLSVESLSLQLTESETETLKVQVSLYAYLQTTVL